MNMPYVILTEKQKTHTSPAGAVYWSRLGGCFSTREHATRFGSFEEAQPTVQRLRREAPHFYFNAINIL